MNATQMGDMIKSILLALGVSSTVIGYVSSEMWIALGGFILSLGSFIWFIIAHRTEKLVAAVAADPAVVQVVVADPVLADKIPTHKVVAPVGVSKATPTKYRNLHGKGA